METSSPASLHSPTEEVPNAKTPNSDGGLGDNHIFSAGPALEHQAVDADSLKYLYRECGVDIYGEGPIVRLLNDTWGSARWTTFSRMSVAYPWPTMHPTYQARFNELMTNSILDQERQAIKELYNKGGAYQSVAHTRFLSRLGSVAWQSFTKSRQLGYKKSCYSTVAKPECPEEVMESLPRHLLALINREGAAQRPVAYSRFQISSEEVAHLQDIAKTTYREPRYQVLSGFIIVDDSLEDLAKRVQDILNAGGTDDMSIEILAFARVLWPNRAFFTTSSVVQEFLYKYDLHLGLLKNSIDSGDAALMPHPDLEALTSCADTPMQSHQPSFSLGDTTAGASSLITTSATTPAEEQSGVFKPYLKHFNDSQQGLDYVYRKHRKPAPADFDDFETVASNDRGYIRRIYQALTAHETVNKGSANLASKFDNKIVQFQAPDKATEAFACVIYKAIVDLHKEGDRYTTKQAKLGTKDKRNPKASERMEDVIDVLKSTESVALDVLNGYDDITRFVAAPLERQRIKKANHDSNKVRAAETDRGRAAQKQLHANSPQKDGADDEIS